MERVNFISALLIILSKYDDKSLIGVYIAQLALRII